MSGLTRKRLIIGCVLLLCVVIVAMMRRPSNWLTVSIEGYQTNVGRVVTARVLISNASPHSLRISVLPPPNETLSLADLLPEQLQPFSLIPLSANAAIVRLRDRQRRVIVLGSRIYSGSISDRVRAFFAHHLYWPSESVTLEIPE